MLAIVARRLSPAREYELVLMLDPDIPDERREQITAEARQRIESGGSLKHDSGWGMRKLAYEIQQRTEADYRFFRFETEGALLDELNHNLRIADGVLRFRIFKVDPRSPTIVPPPPQAAASATPARGGRRPPGAPGRPCAPGRGGPPPAGGSGPPACRGRGRGTARRRAGGGGPRGLLGGSTHRVG